MHLSEGLYGLFIGFVMFQFSAISQAYDVLVDPESREDYDTAEKIKDVLRRGFEAILYLPKRMTYDSKSKRHYPAQLASKQVCRHDVDTASRVY